MCAEWRDTTAATELPHVMRDAGWGAGKAAALSGGRNCLHTQFKELRSSHILLTAIRR